VGEWFDGERVGGFGREVVLGNGVGGWWFCTWWILGGVEGGHVGEGLTTGRGTGWSRGGRGGRRRGRRDGVLYGFCTGCQGVTVQFGVECGLSGDLRIGWGFGVVIFGGGGIARVV